MARSRPSATASSGRTRSGSKTSGRSGTVEASIVAARFSCRRSRVSSRRCGTSRGACSASRPGRCSAARCATGCGPMPGSAATGRTRSARRQPARKAQGFNAVKMNATAELDWIGTNKQFDDVVKRVEAAQAQGMEVGLDFHGRVHRPLAKQLAKVLEPLGLLFIEEPLLSEKWRACERSPRTRRRPSRSASGLQPLGFQALLRTGRGRHHPARPQPRRRNPRGAQDRRDGGGL